MLGGMKIICRLTILLLVHCYLTVSVESCSSRGQNSPKIEPGIKPSASPSSSAKSVTTTKPKPQALATTKAKKGVMVTSEAGIKMIKEMEDFYADFYDDRAPRAKITKGYKPKGKITIGYGYGCHVDRTECKNIKAPISETFADALLRQDLRDSGREGCINRNVKYPKLTQRQFDALVSFSFNRGCKGFLRTALFRKLQRGDLKGVCAEFLNVSGIKKDIANGIKKRGQMESKHFGCEAINKV